MKPGYKQTEVGVIPEDWAMKPLRRISPKQSVGLVINPSTYFDKAGTVPLLVGSNVSENFIDATHASRITTRSNEALPASRLSSGDLVTVRVGEPGVTAVVPPELDGSNCASMMIVRKHASFDSLWLCAAMNSRLGRRQVEAVQYGTAQKQFNISDAVDFKLAVPPYPEQLAIAKALSDAEGLVSGLDRLIAKKRDLKQAAMQQLLAGQTRLPGFNEEWEVKRLGSVATCFSGGTPPTEIAAYYGGDIPWITSGDLNKGYITDVEGRITKAGLANSAAQLVKANTLLVALYGATSGVTAISKIHAAINQAVLAIIPRQDITSFLYFKLNSVKNWLIATYTQGGQPNLSGDIVKSIELLLPPVPEQIAIAEVLMDMDMELVTLEQRRDKTRALKQAIIQELLTGKTRLLQPEAVYA